MDYYLENPERLEGQPKRTIADYVEQNGILVPRRFDSLEEARKSHKAIFLRSEHPQDYSGISGMLESFGLSRRMFCSSRKKIKKFNYFIPMGSDSTEEIKNKYFKFLDESYAGRIYPEFCKITKVDPEEFKKEVSFSIWEKLGGVNRTIIADSAIPKRYHIISCGEKVWNYTIIENGKNKKMFLRPLTGESGNLNTLIELYESVRNLDRFDSNHCPIIEAQTVDGKDYFLQYHKGRNFSPSSFVLNRHLRKGEIEVPFVRGATPEKGMAYKVTVYYAHEGKWNLKPQGEDGSYDFHLDVAFAELRARKRKLEMISAHDFNHRIAKIVLGHDLKSRLFKAQVSIIHNIDDLLRNGETTEKLCKEARRTGRNSYFNLHVTSDGRRAFVKRI
jgi:hypothetical protein